MPAHRSAARRPAVELRASRGVALALAATLNLIFILSLSRTADPTMRAAERPLTWVRVPPPEAPEKRPEQAAKRVAHRFDAVPARPMAEEQRVENVPAAPLEATENIDLVSPSGMRIHVAKALRALPDPDAGKPLVPLPSSVQGRLEAGIASAAVPNCKDGNALQNDPPHLGPIPLGGLLGLPFLGHAMLTGKCRL